MTAITPTIEVVTADLVKPSPRPTWFDSMGHFIGSENYYAHSFLRLRFVYTDGMKYLADNAGAHWLIDIAASYQSRQLDRVCDGFQVWRIRKLAETCVNQAEVTCWTDTPDSSRRMVRQLILSTDFPFDVVGNSFEFRVEGTGPRWVCLLKSEH